jgi:uncharacterized RDD family membrane protein YckC
MSNPFGPADQAVPTMPLQPAGVAPASGAPLPTVSTEPDDVFWPRIAAAVVDLVLLAGLFVIMGAVIGETRGPGPFVSFSVRSLDFALRGWWFIAFLAVVLLYHFVLEAVTGQTVGKRLIGVRVSGAGGRASVGAVAGRTLLRLVDWLPTLYLVGFITMAATGVRRQRVGDLAAGTSVVRAPGRRRALALVPLAVVWLAAVGVSVYRVNSPQPHTYRAHGVSFEYPIGWDVQSHEPAATAGTAPKLWTIAVGPGTERDMITVETYRVNPQNLDAFTRELEGTLRQLFSQTGGALQAGPEKITMAGQPAARFRGTSTVNGSQVESTLVFAFRDTTEYEVNCQHSVARTAEVERACNHVVRSFQVDGGTSNASTATGATPAITPSHTVGVPTATPATRAPAAPSPVSMTAGPMTGRELLWIQAVDQLSSTMDKAFDAAPADLTSSALASLADQLRGCTRELSRIGRSTARLQPLSVLVHQACREYDKGAQCFDDAARLIDATFGPGDAPEQAINQKLDCGFAASGKGGEPLMQALNKAEEITANAH